MAIKIAQYAATELPERPEGYELHLVHVTRKRDTPAVVSKDEPAEVVVEGEEVEVSFVTNRLLSIVKQRYRDSRVVLIHARKAGPTGIGKAICDYAKEKQASIVVIGTHSKRSITEFFVGSVTHFCTHHCTQPLLLLH
ncbi:hypothetical protein WJX72_012134 [[Myrmecia] bisecta]|uniref:UspA domain-containing protein n=1 Tax=[Myrmecia] bisecta TaxID=41462 RepID=A0AAW1QAF5_9CHLO